MKVGVYTLGCKVNIYESEFVIDLLKKSNYLITSFNSICDIYIINTCMVTNESVKKDRKIINQARKRNPKAIIIVMGCYSQLNSKLIDADIIIGNKDKSKIVQLINDYQRAREKQVKIYDLKQVEFEDMTINDFSEHTRAFVKIQDGCNAYCSYCIIPYVRGNIRSKREESVIEEVTNLVNKDYHEVILTGIHTGRYGIDINTDLESLLRKLIKIPNLYRLRLSSIEINEITDDIISLYKNSPILARHFHIPLQSGSNKILKLMNRKYNKEYFIDRINKIRKELPDIAITTDLILGFPDETEEDYQETLTTLKELKFKKVHVFPYSKRDGTRAASMPNQISEYIKKNRVKEVIALSNMSEYDFCKENLNREYELITELRNNKVYGYTTNYILVELEVKEENNKIVRVRLKEIKDNNIVLGEIIA